MAIKELMTELNETIKDARVQDFTYSNTDDVPNSDTSGLTYESGDTKKGKIIKTCVLYVDIRNSVKLIESHQFDTMGKIYTAFTKTVLKIADYHKGKVRNIIGDRVMIVFPVEDCFTNSVKCAISINHAMSEINKTFSHVDFKCGIGIDSGDMRILKVGIEKQGGENKDNKNLVWVGYPANKASRLTDLAGKSISELKYEITYNRFNLAKFFGGDQFFADMPEYTKTVVKVNAAELADKITISENGKMKYLLSEVLKIDKKSETYSFPHILVTEPVYSGFVHSNPNCNSVVKNFWKKINHEIDNVTDNVFGANLIWVLD